MAGPDVIIRSIVEKEITVIENGQMVTKLVPFESGGVDSTYYSRGSRGLSLKLYFTLTITNEGDEVATNVVVDNPIPPETVYSIGSATGEKGVVYFSVDDGVSFHSENERQFNPGQSTDIRWVIAGMPPGSSCKLGFQVFVGGIATSFWTDSSRGFLSQLSRFMAKVRNDKRREPRVVDNIVHIHECRNDPDLVDESISCEGINFSSHGLQLRTDYALVPNTPLNITLSIGDSVTRYQLRGEIRWTEIIDNDCQIGLLFSEEKDFNGWAADVENMYVA